MSFNEFSVSLFNYVKFVSGFGFELIAVDGLVLLLFIFGVLSLQNSASLQNIIDGQRRILMVECPSLRFMFQFCCVRSYVDLYTRIVAT